MKKIYKDICVTRIKYSDYNQFHTSNICEANKDDIYCFLVLLEDSYIYHKDVYDKCAEDIGIEIQPDFAKNIVIGLSRLNGRTIGIVANQSNYRCF